MPRSTWLNILIILLVIIAASYVAQLVLGFVSGFADIFLLLLLSWLVSYALSPLVDGLNERAIFAPMTRAMGWNRGKGLGQRLTDFQVTRPLAVALVYFGVLILVIIVIASLIPAILAQVNGIVPQLSNIDEFETTFTSMFQGILGSLRIEYNIQTFIDSTFSSLQSLATPILQNTVAILTSVLSLLGNVLLVILLSFFFALDGPRFNTMLFDVVPERLHQETRMFLITTDRAFGGFLRSQILQASAIGIGTGIIMSVFGIEAPLLSGVFAGLFMLIPLIGPILSFIPPLLATLLTDPGRILWVMIPIALLQVIVVNMIMPRIMGNALGLHPLVIIVSLLVGVKVGGFWGAFFAMPLAGIISAFGAFLFRRRQRLAELTAAMVHDDASESPPPRLDTSLLVEPHTEMINPSDVVKKESHA
jgi:predicted PurR-regulated permease PerM